MMAARDLAREGVAPMIRPRRGVVQEVGIWPLLQWAFHRECARLDFGSVEWSVSVGLEWVMMQRAQLGCHVDGGGRSDPHPDADVVAGAVAALPVSHGGPSMATYIANAARAGQMPDAMVGAVPVCRPVEVNENQYGRRAVSRDAAALGGIGWPHHVRINRRGVKVADPVLYTPVVWSPTPAQIGGARRGYLAWWGALADLRDTLRISGGLSAFRVSMAMPAREPWK